ncbi:hypothetical protein CJF57_00125 [Staphylococcus phage UPMK_1]|nr:hypothetical protein CJF57_00125 [Staphylococcus phage UPMK_1]
MRTIAPMMMRTSRREGPAGTVMDLLDFFGLNFLGLGFSGTSSSSSRYFSRSRSDSGTSSGESLGSEFSCRS